jgi:hypothetical protein
MLYDTTIAIYILLDDILKTIEHQEAPGRQVNDAMILTTTLLSAWYFGGNWTSACSYMKTHHCPTMLSKSRFNRRLHTLAHCCQACFGLLGWVFKTMQPRQEYVLDTFPVAVCHNIRIRRCRLLNGEAYRGKNTSKREYFYGYKIALLINSQGIPVELAFLPARYGEQAALRALNFDLPAGSVVWQDSGFTDYEWEDFYRENEGIEFATQRRKNSQRGDDFPTYIAKKYNRKKVETSISEITTRFPKRIHAVTIEGFQFKTFFFVFAFMILKYFQA